MKGVFSLLTLFAAGVSAVVPGCFYRPVLVGPPQLVCPFVPPPPPPPVVDFNNQWLTGEQKWVHDHQNAVFQYNENALRFWWGNDPNLNYMFESQRQWKDYFQTIDKNMLENFKEYTNEQTERWYG